MIPRPAGRPAFMITGGNRAAAMFAGAMLLAACPRPGAVAPGRPPVRPGAAQVEPVPPANGLPTPATKAPGSPAPTPTPLPAVPGRGVTAGAKGWAFYRGALAGLGSLTDIASRYRLIAIDADPAVKKATPAQIETLRSGGRNQVLGWLELGSMDPARPFWKSVGEANPALWLGPRAGQAGAQWVDLANASYVNALINGLAKPMVVQGVDGFLLDYVSLAEHLPDAAEGPCGSGCRQGVIDAIMRIRVSFPSKLLVVYGATGDVLRLATASSKQALAPALDGVVGLNTFGPAADPDAARELAAWAAMKLTPDGKPFFVGTDDAIPACSPAQAREAATQARAAGLVPFVHDPAGGLPCRVE